MSVRRNVRERKEYIYRRSLKGVAAQEYEKKRAIKRSLELGVPVPTELRDVAISLASDMRFDDESTFLPPNEIDDEYADAGITDPKIMVTSSHYPSTNLVAFVKEIKLLFPGSQRMNRGGYETHQLVNACRQNGITDLIIAHETRGRPDSLIISHLPYGPTAYFNLSNVVSRHDIKEEIDTMSLVNPHLIFNGFTTALGKRVEAILKHLFPVPKDQSQRVVTFSNSGDFISFRHHTWEVEGHKDVVLSECGPRFEMRLYKILLGSIDMQQAETEYSLRNFLNTANKKTVL